MRKRWFTVVAFCLGMAVAAPMAVAGARLLGSGAGKLTSQGFLDRNAALTTSSTAWQNVTDLSGLFCAKNEMAVNVSVNVHGAPVGVRVKIDSGATLDPGPAFFYPPSGGRSASFSSTFVIIAGTFEGRDGHTLDVQWRSLGGGSATLDRALMNVQFQDGDPAKCGP